MSHRTAGIRTFDIRTLVSFALLTLSHCWHSHCWLRIGVVRTFVFRTLVVQAKHSLQIDRVRGDDVLAKEHCLYERDRRLRCEDEKTSLRLRAMSCGLLPFFSEVDKVVVDPR